MNDERDEYPQAEEAPEQPESQIARPEDLAPPPKSSVLALAIGNRGVMFTDVDGALKYATACFKSGMLNHIKTAQQAFVILANGQELGLKPWAAWKTMYVTKQGRIAVMTKGALAIAQASPRYENYEERIEMEGTPEMYAVAIAKTKGLKPVEKRFSLADAKAAGLLERKKNFKGEEYDGPWQAFVKYMLLARARDRALSIAYAAELAGIEMETIAEDADRLEAARAGAPVTPVGPPRDEPAVSDAPRALPEGSRPDPLIAMALKQAGKPVPAEAVPSAPPAPAQPAPKTQEAAASSGAAPVVAPAAVPPGASAQAAAIAQSVDEAFPSRDGEAQVLNWKNPAPAAKKGRKKDKDEPRRYKPGDIFLFGKTYRRVCEVDENGHPVLVEKVSDEEVVAYLASLADPKPQAVAAAEALTPAPEPAKEQPGNCPRDYCGAPLNLYGDCDKCGYPRSRFE